MKRGSSEFVPSAMFVCVRSDDNVIFRRSVTSLLIDVTNTDRYLYLYRSRARNEICVFELLEKERGDVDFGATN